MSHEIDIINTEGDIKLKQFIYRDLYCEIQYEHDDKYYCMECSTSMCCVSGVIYLNKDREKEILRVHDRSEAINGVVSYDYIDAENRYDRFDRVQRYLLRFIDKKYYNTNNRTYRDDFKYRGFDCSQERGDGGRYFFEISTACRIIAKGYAESYFLAECKAKEIVNEMCDAVESGKENKDG